MSKKKNLINAATIGLGFGLSHAKTFKKNKYVKLIGISDTDKKKKNYEKNLIRLFLKI